MLLNRKFSTNFLIQKLSFYKLILSFKNAFLHLPKVISDESFQASLYTHNYLKLITVNLYIKFPIQRFCVCAYDCKSQAVSLAASCFITSCKALDNVFLFKIHRISRCVCDLQNIFLSGSQHILFVCLYEYSGSFCRIF